MRSNAAFAAILATVAGCTDAPGPLTSRFEPAEVAWFAARGTNTITGSAILRTARGTVKTCAALPVTLFPVSIYARERMRALYGSEEDGFNPYLGGRPADFGGDDPRYFTTARTTRCDAKGRFSFTELPDGAYYVVTTITWRDGKFRLESGGSLMLQVHVQTGESRDILLAH